MKLISGFRGSSEGARRGRHLRLAVELSLEPALALESDTIPTFDMSTRSYRIPLSGISIGWNN